MGLGNAAAAAEGIARAPGAFARMAGAVKGAVEGSGEAVAAVAGPAAVLGGTIGGLAAAEHLAGGRGAPDTAQEQGQLAFTRWQAGTDRAVMPGAVRVFIEGELSRAGKFDTERRNQLKNFLSAYDPVTGRRRQGPPVEPATRPGTKRSPSEPGLPWPPKW